MSTRTSRLIACADCHRLRPHNAHGLCMACYHQRRRSPEGIGRTRRSSAIRADGAPRSDWWRRYHASRRPGLPRRVYGLDGLVSEGVR